MFILIRFDLRIDRFLCFLLRNCKISAFHGKYRKKSLKTFDFKDYNVLYNLF